MNNANNDRNDVALIFLDERDMEKAREVYSQLYGKRNDCNLKYIISETHHIANKLKPGIGGAIIKTKSIDDFFNNAIPEGIKYIVLVSGKMNGGKPIYELGSNTNCYEVTKKGLKEVNYDAIIESYVK